MEHPHVFVHVLSVAGIHVPNYAVQQEVSDAIISIIGSGIGHTRRISHHQ